MFTPIFNFHKLFRLTFKIFSHHKLNLKSTFLNFGQIHLSILSHLKLNFASSSFPFFAQPKHFAFLAPSIKLTLVVTTLQRWLIYWKKPLPCYLWNLKNIHLLFVKSKNIHQLLLSKHIYQMFVKLVKFGHIGNQLVTSIESQDMSAFIYIYVCVSHIQISPQYCNRIKWP